MKKRSLTLAIAFREESFPWGGMDGLPNHIQSPFEKYSIQYFNPNAFLRNAEQTGRGTDNC